MKCKINEIRRAKRIKLKDLADQAGISRITLWRIESGKVSPRVEILTKISELLNVEQTELYEAA